MKHKIVFDKESIASFGKPNDKDNSPEQLVQRKHNMLLLLAKLCNAPKIEYVDNDKSETYIITKRHAVYTLEANGNHYDGGWINIYKKTKTKPKIKLVH